MTTDGEEGEAFGAAFPRYDQTFPTLTDAEIERLRKFGTVRTYVDGERMFTAGQPSPGMFVMLSGRVCISQRDGLGHVTPVIEEGPGQFLAEIGQLTGRPALVDGHAEGVVEALVIPPDQLRALLVAEAEFGERIMRALILRRVALIEAAASGAVLIGPPEAAGVLRLENFLVRNGQPHHLLDPAHDAEAAAIIARYAPAPGELPLVVCPNGDVLKNPSEAELGRVLGMAEAPRRALYDVVVVGAGPAGLATAVYGASEGLSMAVLDQRAFGGQAGASARIENYFGFPTGVTGIALVARGFNQAQKFGAEMLIPAEVESLDCSRAHGPLAIQLVSGERLSARTVVVASGARYRRPGIPNLADFEGHGVWYWASPIEAQLVKGQEVILVGGGNSAGQAAVFLAAHAAKVRMMVRAEGLAASMSRYLIDRIEATANIQLMTRTEITALEGDPETGLAHVRWRDHGAGEVGQGDIANVFLFVGADPATAWLEGCGVEVDDKGFVITAPGGLASSVPGVFAVGDARSGSVKRVGAAIGEGAQVVAAIHQFLALEAEKETA